jgi:hypothetical protein
VMNPPYMGAKFTGKRLGQLVRDRLQAQHGFQGDLLSHFLVEAVTQLKPGGVLGAIVSDTFFSAETAAAARRRLLADARLGTIAWCRPFKNVAVRGGILIVVRDQRERQVWWTFSRDAAPDASLLKGSAPSVFHILPTTSLFPPTDRAVAATNLWARVKGLQHSWKLANARDVEAKRRQLDSLKVGDWTLLGMATHGGQGLATGDDREFVAYVQGTDEAALAVVRVDKLIRAIEGGPRLDPRRPRLQRMLAQGISGADALRELNRAAIQDPRLAIPGRKPFLIASKDQVRTRPLTRDECSNGINGKACWVSYEIGDRSAADRGGAEWVRQSPTVIEWSRRSVRLLQARARRGPRRPFWRNSDLWFSSGVTHNRIASQLRARILPSTSMFSSESPMYTPLAEWLDRYALLALLNSDAIRFLVHTFLATRNHVEVGHVRRAPVPVLSDNQRSALSSLGRSAVEVAVKGTDAKALARIHHEINIRVSEAYGWARD